MSLAKLWCFENDVSDLLSQLILTDLQIANLDVGAIIAIDTPTVRSSHGNYVTCNDFIVFRSFI